MPRLQHRARFSSPSVTTVPDVTLVLAAPLGTATQNLAYSSAFIASAGTPPYLTYTITAGALPTGLSLSGSTGAVTGTPTVPATYTFTGRVVDAAGGIATIDGTIVVDPAADFVASHPRLVLTAAKITEITSWKTANTACYQSLKTSFADVYTAIGYMPSVDHVTTLTSALAPDAAAGATCTVADGSSFPTAAFLARVGVELMKFTRSGNTLTVVMRGDDPSNQTTCDGYRIVSETHPEQMIAHTIGESVYQHDASGNAAGLLLACSLLRKMGLSGYDAKIKTLLSYTAIKASNYYWDLSGYRWGSYEFALGYDWNYDLLTTVEKALYADFIRRNAQYQIDHPQAEDGSTQAQRYLEGAWCGNQPLGQMRGVLAGAAATYGDNTSAVAQWNAMLTKFTTYVVPGVLNGPFGGGNTVEGAEYMTESWTEILNILELIKTATGANYYSSIGSFLTNLAKYLIYSTRPDATPTTNATVFPYGDVLNVTNFQDYPFTEYHQMAAAMLLDVLKTADPTWAGYLRYWYVNVAKAPNIGYVHFKFPWYDESVAAVNYKSAGLATAYGATGSANTGIIFSRSDWTDTPTWGIFYGGSWRYVHAQSEIATYAIMRNGVWLTKNLGGYSWVDYATWSSGRGHQSEWPYYTAGHKNGVLLNNHSLASYLIEGQAQGPPTMERAILTSTYSYGRCDATSVAISPTPRAWDSFAPLGAAGFLGGVTTNDALTYKRDWLHVLPGVFVIYDRATFAVSAASQVKWMAIFNGNPTVAGQNISLTVSSQQIVEDILVPTAGTLTKTTLSTESATLSGYRVQTVSGATSTLEELFKVIQTGASGFTVNTVSLLTSTNAYVTQCGTTILGAVRGTSVTLPISYVVSGVPLHYLMGLAATTYYKVTRAVNTITIAADDTTNRQQSTAAGVLSFTL